MRTFCVLLCVVVVVVACSSKPATTPEQCYARLQLALGPARGPQLYALLDEQSRWAVMSAHRALRQAHRLILASYPAKRRQRALGRVVAAAKHQRPGDYLGELLATRRLQVPGQRLGALISTSVKGPRATLRAKGGTVVCCKDGQGWGYCGLREPLELLKLRAARELKSVQQNAAVFRRGSR